MADPPRDTVLICASRGEKFTQRAGLRLLCKQLKTAGCALQRIEAGSQLTAAAVEGAALLVFGGPTQPHSEAEINVLQRYLHQGVHTAMVYTDMQPFKHTPDYSPLQNRWLAADPAG